MVEEAGGVGGSDQWVGGEHGAEGDGSYAL